MLLPIDQTIYLQLIVHFYISIFFVLLRAMNNSILMNISGNFSNTIVLIKYLKLANEHIYKVFFCWDFTRAELNFKIE